MNHVLIISHDVVASHMAGPGIRTHQLARVLSREFRVSLAVPGSADLGMVPFDVWPYHRDQWNSLAAAANQADVIVASGDTLADLPALTALPIPLVIDGYDPHTLETLALWAGLPAHVQTPRHAVRLDIVRRQCQAGDYFICASERQRDWWLGVLEHYGRINPKTYAADPSLRQLIDVVPYGLPSEPPQAMRPVLRGVWPGLGVEDRIVLWGGGLWEWLDPLTAIRGMGRLAERGPAAGRIRLVFPGTRHPNPLVPDMPMRQRALALADELGLTGRSVFFGDWVPYADWPAVLLEADLGISLHPDTVEARLAYRSRVMDYVWAGLPMVVTRGDAAADLVEQYELGLVVNYEDDGAVCDGILRLLDAGDRQRRFDVARRELTWERVAEPLVAFCRHPRRAPDRPQQSGAVRDRPQQGGAVGVNSLQAMKQPSITVLVLVWNGVEYIQDCLTAVLAQEYPAFEVLVVDNGSSDGTPDLVAERFPGVKLLRNKRNLGFAAGNNVGLRACRGDVIVLLNHDTQVLPGWLEALATALGDPTVGLVGCKLLYPDGTVQHAGGYLFGPQGNADHVGRHALDDGRFDQMTDVEYATGAALAIRKSAMDQIGLLDEGFGRAYYEDADWCYRARRAGYRIVYQPRAAVVHHESVAMEASSFEQKLAVNQGRVRFLFKHRTLDELLQEFCPAEMAWIRLLDRSTDLMALRHAYLQTLLALPELVAYRGCTVAEADLLIGVLTDLRAATLPAEKPASGPVADPTLPGGRRWRGQRPATAFALPGGQVLAQRDRLQQLERTQALVEQPFRSKMPVLGPVIAALRSLWNSVSTKWYVGSLVRQQNAFNALVVQYLHGQSQLDKQPSSTLPDQASELAEAIRESTALAVRLAWSNMRQTQPSPRTVVCEEQGEDSRTVVCEEQGERGERGD